MKALITGASSGIGKEMAKKVYDENITYDEYYTFYLDNK